MDLLYKLVQSSVFINMHKLKLSISYFIWDVITYPCLNFNNSLTNPSLRLWYAWMNTFHYFLMTKLLSHVLILMLMWLIQYIPRNMHTVFALLWFVVVIHWLIFPYPSGLLHWHCGNLTIAPVLAKRPWWIWINTSCECIMNDCVTTTKQTTTKGVHISWDILYLLDKVAQCSILHAHTKLNFFAQVLYCLLSC